MDCIDYLGAGLQSAFSRSLPPSCFRDDEGVVRVRVQSTSYQGLVEAAVNQIRQASPQKCDVSCRLLEMLAHTAAVSQVEEQQEALLYQAVLIKQGALREQESRFDQDALTSRFDKVVEACSLVEPPDEESSNE